MGGWGRGWGMGTAATTIPKTFANPSRAGSILAAQGGGGGVAVRKEDALEGHPF